MAYALITVFGAACVVGVVAWVSIVWNLFRVPFNLKPGVDPWTLGNPFNNLFKSEALTSEGLAARRRAGVSLSVFGGALVVGAIAGAMAKWLA
jgi:hypothetical protein